MSWSRCCRVSALPIALIAAQGCVAITEAAPAPARTSALEARVATLEAREEIRALLLEYGRLLDAGDFAGYAALFAEDGEWIGGLGRHQGRAAIQAMLEASLEPGPRERLTSLHLMSNEVIDVGAGGDAATARSRWFFIVTGEEGRPALLFAGRYEDELVRQDGRWLFKRRVAYGDIPYDDPLAESE